jgi:diguanylate cyclase (GGDEF)-like protein/PAS domain S-box-containing protein
MFLLAVLTFVFVILDAIGASPIASSERDLVLVPALTSLLLLAMLSLRHRWWSWHGLGSLIKASIRSWVNGKGARTCADLFVATPTPSLLVDCGNLRILDANPAAAALYGYTPAEFRRLGMADLLEPVAVDEFAWDRDQHSGLPGVSSGLARHRRADGSGVRVEMNIQRTAYAGRAVWLLVVSDVTARIQLAQELEASERHFRELIELSLGMVFIHDLDGRLQMVNPAFARSLGYVESELIGHNLAEFVVPRHRDAFADYLRKVGTHGRDADSAHMLRRDGGECVWEFRNQLRIAPDGSQQVLCCAIDISNRSRYERQLLESSRKDPLTGCYNRRHFAMFEAQAKPGARWACAVIDIDHFKRYNDTYGHRAGDQALVDTARFLDELARGQGSVVRLGGDEFVILLEHCDPILLEAFSIRLQTAITTQAPVPISFGLTIRADGEDLQQTIHRADQQMIEHRLTERSTTLKRPHPSRRLR